MNQRKLSLVEPVIEQPDKARPMQVSVVSPEAEFRAEVCSALEDMPDTGPVSQVGTRLRSLGVFAPNAVPDLLILNAGDGSEADFEAVEQMSHRYPDLAFIMVCQEPDLEFLLQAMRCGVREVLSAPLTRSVLHASVERVRRRIGLNSPKRGRVLAFIPCKGGSGSTFLAANLAHALATSQGQKVALIDINLQFGDALTFLSDQPPVSNLSQVAKDVHRLDAAFLASSMVNVSTGLSVLAAPEDPAQGTEVTPAHVEAILRLARNQYDWVVLDVARTLDAPTVKALDHADMIFTVLQSTLPFIRDARRMLDIFHTLDYPDSKVNLVVNRHEKGSDISIDDVERSLGRKVARTVPNHYAAAAASVNQGVPVTRLAKASALSRALLQWSEELSPREQESRHWIARMFKRA